VLNLNAEISGIIRFAVKSPRVRRMVRQPAVVIVNAIIAIPLARVVIVFAIVQMEILVTIIATMKMLIRAIFAIRLAVAVKCNIVNVYILITTHTHCEMLARAIGTICVVLFAPNATRPTPITNRYRVVGVYKLAAMLARVQIIAGAIRAIFVARVIGYRVVAFC
jgi:hypothetical protein